MSRLFGLCRPFHVIGARPNATQLENKLLHVTPEFDLLERIIEPTGGDAKVGVMRGHVMDTVMDTRQDDVHVLEDGNVARQAKIRVRPFVKLFNFIYIYICCEGNWTD